MVVVGTDSDVWRLSAPEYLLLMRQNGLAPADALAVRAGLIDAIMRGCLEIHRRQVPAGRGTREEWHVVPGGVPPRPPLDAIVAAVDAAPAAPDVEGRPGRTVSAVLTALARSGVGTYTDRHVLPALAAAGLVTDVRPQRWFRSSRYTATPPGEAEGAAAAQRVAAARRAVAAVPRRGDAEAVRQAQLDAAMALGAAGAVVAAEQDLLRAAADLRKADAGGDTTTVMLLSASTGSEDDRRGGELYDAVDAGAFDGSSSGGSWGDGGSGGWGDGGGGGGGGD